MYVRRRMANYLCAMNVVSMGAKVAASGVLGVRRKDASILSVVVAMTVIHFSSKFIVEEFGRVAGVASSFLAGFSAAINMISCFYFA